MKPHAHPVNKNMEGVSFSSNSREIELRKHWRRRTSKETSSVFVIFRSFVSHQNILSIDFALLFSNCTYNKIFETSLWLNKVSEDLFKTC